MNKFKNIFTGILFLSAIVFLNSCKEDDFDIPPVNIPTVNFDANTTIPELLAMHTAGGLESIDTNIIIKGIVVANDISENIYKKIYLEDDSAGIEIPLEGTELNKTYPVGQRVYIKCNGLVLGEYKGNMQLGYLSGGVVSRIPTTLIPEHLFLDSLPGPSPVPTLRSDFSGYTNFLNMLVKVENIHFDPAVVGLPLSESSASTSRTMIDQNGNTLVLYTSSFANFASNLIPADTGSVTGVIIKYNSSYEFIIRDLNDLQDFNN